MGRWEPNARGRLEQAALELFDERGFDETTVKEITQRAGLTERTFFRHFADKREVLFPHTNPLQQILVAALAETAATAEPIDAVAAALQAATDLFQDRWDIARRRQAVITANPELQERELIKLAGITAALTDTLRRSGVAERPARLSAEAGVAVFKVAFELWIRESEQPDLSHLIQDAFDELKALTKS